MTIRHIKWFFNRIVDKYDGTYKHYQRCFVDAGDRRDWEACNKFCALAFDRYGEYW